ncbi:hypothetical protein [Nocardia sp. NPDC049707]|uniref:hypothetical protein n=1 Tax=Nocardia sp. NPDC049707 TaxID=3154735 RepID=UPI00342184E5
MTTTTTVSSDAVAHLIDGLHAIEHHLRWDNQGAVAAQIKALTDRFERDSRP